MEVAASKGLPSLKYHLLPRTKGFTTAVQCLRGTGKPGTHGEKLESITAHEATGQSENLMGLGMLLTWDPMFWYPINQALGEFPATIILRRWNQISRLFLAI